MTIALAAVHQRLAKEIEAPPATAETAPETPKPVEPVPPQAAAPVVPAAPPPAVQPPAALRPKRKKRSRRRRAQEAPANCLRFSPTAWAKLLFLRDAGETEVGGFGISDPDDPLYIQDFQLVSQECDWASVKFDADAIADFFDAQVDAGRKPAEFARIWIHTHPGDCPKPSMTDERTFEEVFGSSGWSVMFIIARRGDTYARLQVKQDLRLELPLDVEIDYSVDFGATDQAAWWEEYAEHVRLQMRPPLPTPSKFSFDRRLQPSGTILREPMPGDRQLEVWEAGLAAARDSELADPPLDAVIRAEEEAAWEEYERQREELWWEEGDYAY